MLEPSHLAGALCDVRDAVAEVVRLVDAALARPGAGRQPGLAALVASRDQLQAALDDHAPVLDTVARIAERLAAVGGVAAGAAGNPPGMADPVSWYAVERGWRVQSMDGTPVGVVEEVLGDESLDIFNGLTVSLGVGRVPRYVPAELVGPIEPGNVTLSLLADELGTLGPAADGP